jgi:branched-chain amino acid transport system permease protein
MDNLFMANVLAFAVSVVVMFVVAWLVERLVLRHLVNQEGATLLMATIGITYVLDGVGQTIFGSDIYKIDVGMPKDPVMMLESVFEGGILINKEDFIAALISRLAGGGADDLLPEDRDRTRAARRGGRPPGGAVDRHSAGSDLGHRLVRRRHYRAGGWHHLGFQAGRAVLAVDRGLARPAGGDPRRPDLGSGRDHRRPDHRRRRKAVRGLSRPDYVGGGIEIWFAYMLALVFLLFRPQGLFGEKIIDRV